MRSKSKKDAKTKTITSEIPNDGPDDEVNQEDPNATSPKKEG